jgi:hypothetical protein
MPPAYECMARWAWLRMDQRMGGAPIMDVANGGDHPRDVNFFGD